MSDRRSIEILTAALSGASGDWGNDLADQRV